MSCNLAIGVANDGLSLDILKWCFDNHISAYYELVWLNCVSKWVYDMSKFISIDAWDNTIWLMSNFLWIWCWIGGYMFVSFSVGKWVLVVL